MARTSDMFVSRFDSTLPRSTVLHLGRVQRSRGGRGGASRLRQACLWATAEAGTDDVFPQGVFRQAETTWLVVCFVQHMVRLAR